MDSRKLSKPIVMAKPMRGREMQTTIIPKDVVDAVRAVSTKQISGQSIVENLQKPREGDVEVYHEGYIDGKLYLVPDTNLQAMRDIVNLKMKRRHSSVEKPQTSLDEPTQYTEFRSKLDSLLGKIDELADSSSDESKSLKGSKKSKRRSKKKKKQDSQEKSEKLNTDIPSSVVGESDKKHTKSELPDQKTLPKRSVISPMMDENISYIRVRPKGLKKPERSSKDTLNSGLEMEEKIKNDHFDLIEYQNLPKELTTDTFKILISGHLKNGAVPIFINHHNYTGPNILENETPDFKTHKTEGNIDIFIAGKFFTFDILKEESSESPAILDVKPHKIEIDKNKDVHRKKFKDIYKVGPLEVALEGEFKKNSKTQKYTPIFSLNIIKNCLLQENMALENVYANQSPTIVLQNQQIHAISSKHVHYASGNTDSLPEDVNHTKHMSPKNKSVYGKLKNTKIYRKLFPKNEENIHSDKNFENEPTSSSQQMKSKTSKSRREELARLRRSRLKDRKATRGQNRKLRIVSHEGHSSLSEQVFNCDSHLTQSPFETKDALITDKTVKEEGSKTRKVKKVRKEKQDKNQAIVENPILAQMQEFFIA